LFLFQQAIVLTAKAEPRISSSLVFQTGIFALYQNAKWTLSLYFSREDYQKTISIV